MKHAACTLIPLTLCCYLGLHANHLALWKDSDTKPLFVFPYSVSMYPQADQMALREGIPYYSQNELTKLLEDYLS